jgi:ABC-type uncharacterized transport system substrate-binding protein
MAAPAALAAKAATATIPIVFNTGIDPVKLGLVVNLGRPRGNMTGVSQLSGLLLAKQMELLRELIPSIVTFSFLVNPNNPDAEDRTREMQAASRSLGLPLHGDRLQAPAVDRIHPPPSDIRLQRSGPRQSRLRLVPCENRPRGTRTYRAGHC